MVQVLDQTEPLRAVIDAEDLKGLALTENELTRFLRDFPEDTQKIAALERLKVRAQDWKENDLSRYLLLRIAGKLQHLKARALRRPEQRATSWGAVAESRAQPPRTRENLKASEKSIAKIRSTLRTVNRRLTTTASNRNEAVNEAVR